VFLVDKMFQDGVVRLAEGGILTRVDRLDKFQLLLASLLDSGTDNVLVYLWHVRVLFKVYSELFSLAFRLIAQNQG
jgi:hypothetical protein